MTHYQSSNIDFPFSYPDLDGNFTYIYHDSALVGTDFNYFAVKINPEAGTVVEGPLNLLNATYQGHRPYGGIIPLSNGKYALYMSTTDEGGVFDHKDRLLVINEDFDTITDLIDFGGGESKARTLIFECGGLDDTIFMWNFVDDTIEKITDASTVPAVTTFHDPASDFVDSAGIMRFGRANGDYVFGGMSLYGLDGLVYIDGIFEDYYLADTINTCIGTTSIGVVDPFGWYRTQFAGVAS
jgi:hypothetical protein